VRHDDRGTWALVARDTAGILAAWSLRTEPNPGPLAEAARAIARSAQLRHAQVPGTPRRPFPPTQSTAQLLLRSGTRAPSSGILLSLVASLAEALREMHGAAGEAQRAAELEQTVIAQLATVRGTESSPSERLEPGAAHNAKAERRLPAKSSRPLDVDR